LQKDSGGRGVLLGGVPGVAPAKVVVIGGGMVGTHAAAMAVGMEADVWVLDRNVDVLRRLWQQFGSRINTAYSTRHALETHCADADLVIGGVLIPGASAPKLVDREILRTMRDGSVVVDVAIDQGGCFETSRPTTHDDPVYVEEGVIHYCVANMPGGVPRTSTFALNNATMPFVLALANHGEDALRADPHLREGLNVIGGKVTCEPVAQAQNLPYVPAEQALGSA
jgi:alanine dehydrogenase